MKTSNEIRKMMEEEAMKLCSCTCVISDIERFTSSSHCVWCRIVRPLIFSVSRRIYLEEKEVNNGSI